MIVPDVINYLLTLRYPGSESGRQNWVCYRSALQFIVPIFPPGTTVQYTIRPLNGVHGYLSWSSRFGHDMVPNTFNAILEVYGTMPLNAVLSALVVDIPFEHFTLITDQEPTKITMSNNSPLAQRGEVLIDYLVIPSPEDLKTITDALRRLETSKESEQLLQQAVYLLGVLANQPLEPLPAVGGAL